MLWVPNPWWGQKLENSWSAAKLICMPVETADKTNPAIKWKTGNAPGEDTVWETFISGITTIYSWAEVRTAHIFQRR